MKSLVLSIALLFGMTTAVYAEAEKTKVCVDVKDKEGKRTGTLATRPPARFDQSDMEPLFYDKETDTFCYYTDSLKDVSYDILETVARKFVIDYDCKMICLQTDVDNKKDSDVAKDKKSTDINTLESNILNQHVQSVFAKFKKYNTGGKGAAPNFNSAVKVFEQMNHFRYKGKLHDYEETQKKYQPPIVDDKPILDYASYKKLLEKEKEN